MTFYGLDEWFWTMFDSTPMWPNFTFGQLYMWAHNNLAAQLCFPSDVLVGYDLVCWSLTSLCHSNGHIETMPAREINPFTALTRIRSQFLRTQWSTSNHQRVSTTALQTAQPSGLASCWLWDKTTILNYVGDMYAYITGEFRVHT